MINSFRGEYAFLSNFYKVPILYKGLWYKSSEAAYQAQKCLYKNQRKEFCNLESGKAKRLGKKVKTRSDWEEVKISIMRDIIFTKFSMYEGLKQKLLDTENQRIIEGNTWGDTFWGVYNGKGKNVLGKILMQVRVKLREDEWDEIL